MKNISDELNLQSAAIPTNSNKYGQRINIYIEENGERIDGSYINDKIVQYFGYKELVKSIYIVNKLERFTNQKLNRIQIAQNTDSNIIYECNSSECQRKQNIEKQLTWFANVRDIMQKKLTSLLKRKINLIGIHWFINYMQPKGLLERKIQHEEYFLRIY